MYTGPAIEEERFGASPRPIMFPEIHIYMTITSSVINMCYAAGVIIMLIGTFIVSCVQICFEMSSIVLAVCSIIVSAAILTVEVA